MQTELVGHPTKTTHELQDVMSPIDKCTLVWTRWVLGFEHHEP